MRTKQKTKTLAERVRELRTRSQLSQEQLARRAGLATSVICKIEQGVVTDPAWSTMRQMAAAMGCGTNEFEGEAK